jgi:subtilase family serine protease
MKRHSIPTGRVFGLISGALFAATAMAQQQGPPDFSHAAAQAQINHVPVCPGPAAAGTARCHAHVVTDDKGQPLATSGPTGYAPADLRTAYNITVSGSSSTIVAIVDAYGYPNAESDLAVYRTQFNLPPCTTANGCFRKIDQNGGTSYPRADTGWSQETALDLQMVSAICPNCKILLVEAKTSSLANLAAAVSKAGNLGAHVISNSYGGGESGSSSYERSYDWPGVAVTVSSGDSGYGVQFPASSPHVIAVGGTSLKRATATTRGWTETVWSGAGSGCSTTYAKPSWQTDTACSNRTVADVSAVADPNTGVSVYGPVNSRSSGWMVFGGTSVAAPLIGGVYGVNGGAVAYGSDPYSHTSSLFDVTSGSNGSCSGSYLCTAGTGYDGPTGLGTPNGTNAF